MIVHVAPIVRLPYARDAYDYTTDDDVNVGHIVRIPLRNRSVDGVIVALPNDAATSQKLRPIVSVEKRYTIPKASIGLFSWMRDEYGVGYGLLYAPLLRSIDPRAASFVPCHDAEMPIRAHTSRRRRSLRKKNELDWISANTMDEKNRVITECWTSNNKGQVLVLFPNIILLEQAHERCKSLLPHVIHSGVSRLQLLDVGKRLLEQQPILVFATRTGLFLPWTHLAHIVVVDESHEDHRPLESSPRYFTVDVAQQLAHFSYTQCTATGVTPSLRLWHHLTKIANYPAIAGSPDRGRGDGLSAKGGSALGGRIADLSKTTIVDMNGRPPEERHIAHECFQTTVDTIADGKSVLLIHEHLGNTTTLRCPSCNWLVRCATCASPLIAEKKSLCCRRCQQKQPIMNECPRCKAIGLLETAPIGIARIRTLLERDLAQQFPDNPPAIHIFSKQHQLSVASCQLPVVVLASSYAFDRIEILQKALHPLGCIGVLSLDSVFSRDMYASAELVFMRLVQCRATATEHAIPLLVQTRFPTHHCFTALADGSLTSFYVQELTERTQFKFPPVYATITARFREPDAKKRKKLLIEASHLLTPFADVETRISDPLIIIHCKEADRTTRQKIQNTLLEHFIGKITLTVE